MVGPSNIPGQTASVPMTAGRGLVYDDVHYANVDPILVRHSSFVSWRAVVAGSLFAVSLLILSGALAAAVGLTGYTYTPEGTYTFSIGAGIWMLISSLVAYFLGGSLAATLSVYRGRVLGPIHGLLSWALSLPMLIILMGSVTTGIFGRIPYFVGDTTRITPGLNTNLAIPASYTTAAWFGFLSLLVGLIAAAIGGAAPCGVVDRLAPKANPAA